MYTPPNVDFLPFWESSLQFAVKLHWFACWRCFIELEANRRGGGGRGLSDNSLDILVHRLGNTTLQVFRGKQHGYRHYLKYAVILGIVLDSFQGLLHQCCRENLIFSFFFFFFSSNNIQDLDNTRKIVISDSRGQSGMYSEGRG